METVSSPTVADNPVMPGKISKGQKAAGVLIVITSVLFILSYLSFRESIITTSLSILSGVLLIIAFAILASKAAGQQVRTMTYLLLITTIVSTCISITNLTDFLSGGSLLTVSKVSTVFDVVCLLLILIQMYAVSIMTRVCDAGTRPYFVMIQLWLTSCLIPTFTSIIYVGKTPADIAYMVLRGNEFFFLFRCVLVFLYVVSWKRIARTYLFAGKGQNVETVPYSPLNKFLVGPLVCIAVVIVLSIVIRLILN